MYTIIRRVMLAVPALVVVTGSLFIVVVTLLGSPASLMLGEDASLEQIEALNKEYGFDRPAVVQYVDWAFNAVQGDFGTAFLTGQRVSDAVLDAVPVTFELAAWSTLLAVLAAVGLNTIPTLQRLIAPVVTFFGLIGITVPAFMVGILLIFIFSVELGILPTTGWVPWSEGPLVHLRHLVLPVICMASYHFGLFNIVYRAEYRHVLDRLFIKVAYAKGLSRWQVTFRHVLPNAILPVITFVGISFGTLLSGATVTETVFSVPGLGRLFVNSVMQNDYPVIMAVACLMVTTTIVMNLAADIAYTLANPQIRLD